MGERIKELRKFLHLTQKEFGERIGVKGNTIAQYESGRNNPVDSALALICREFNVNENWLRTGEGEMFNPEPTDKLEELAMSHGLSPRYAAVVRSLLSLPPEKQDTIVQFVLDTADALRAVEKKEEADS